MQSIAVRRNPSNPSQSIQSIIAIQSQSISNPSQSIAIHRNPSNPSQSIAIHRNPSQSIQSIQSIIAIHSQSIAIHSQSTRNPSQRQLAHRLNAQHGSNAQHSRVRTCRRALERGWGVAQGCVDREDGEVVLLTAPEKLRRRQGLRRGEQSVSDAGGWALSRSHCACGVPQGRSQVVWSCEQRL